MREINIRVPDEAKNVTIQLKGENIAGYTITDLILLAKEIERVTRVTLPELISKKRNKQLVMARQMFSYIAHKAGNFSLSEIGRFLNRDHSTIIYSRDNAKDMLDIKDAFFTQYYNRIKDEFKN